MKVLGKFVKPDFVANNFSEQERLAIIQGCDETAVIKETEKAIKVQFVTEPSTFEKWLPKSVLTEEEPISWVERYNQFFENAKAKGVKGIRYRMRMGTIIEKARNQGIKLD